MLAHARLFTLIAIAFSLPSLDAGAYPEFIGYGYTGCITCHYNPNGNGPLNDYGRAVFATEIAARDAYPPDVTDEKLGESSGFLGSKQLPWWFRPGIKYRGLWLHTDPGSSEVIKRYLTMQQEVNAAFHFDRDQKLAFVGTLGTVQRAGRGTYRTEVWASREAYVRWQALQSVNISVGMLEKVYGIRIPDHTAYSRNSIALDAHSTTVGNLDHGVVVNWQGEKTDVSLNYFMGNMNEANWQRKAGGSLMTEYSIAETARVGASFLSSSGERGKLQLVGVHSRTGVGHGSALLAEVGYQKKEDIDTAGTSTNSSAIYGMAQTTILMRRGYNIFSQVDYLKPQENSTTESFRWTFGLLMFPIQRTEFRLMGTDARTWSPDQAIKDRWTLQLQLHLSI